ncbi:MAG TPA: 2-phospho-L-lactate transferase [Aggregatilineales bacterium]|nr:2-phospho-L-lactate transferase [Anaerolineales bacterium]HRE47583.1 2-phospho-L-lactate transferase [Aggregatilineales bacterium]
MALTPSVVVLAGGGGGARMVDGLARALPAGALTVIANTGDDFRFHGLAVSPDLDSILYTLAGRIGAAGWGIADDTREMIGMLAAYGEEVWFGLGDRDVATSILRTEWLSGGLPLSVVMADLAKRLGVATRLLPMTDQPVATQIDTAEHGLLDFQSYFVRHRWQPTARAIHYAGAANADAAPGVLHSIEEADLIVLAPSNPVLSIAPILAVQEIRTALERRRGIALAVSPLIGGKAIKGPTVKIMGELGLEASVAGIYAYYASANLLDGMLVDPHDAEGLTGMAGLTLHPAEIMLDTPERRLMVARTLLDWAAAERRRLLSVLD